jgi:hypothetical protein
MKILHSLKKWLKNPIGKMTPEMETEYRRIRALS